MSFKRNKRQVKTDLQLFDPITCEKKKTTYELLIGITEMPLSTLSGCKSGRRIIQSLGCYLIDSSFTAKDLLELMDKTVVDTEVWKNIDSDGIYQVSTFGRVRRTYLTRKPKFLMPYSKSTSKNNWLFVKVIYNGKYREKPVHRLVGETFVPKDKKDSYAVVHKNGNCLDNRVCNLQWVTKKDVAKIGRKNFSIPVLKLDPITLEVLDEFSSIKEAALSVYVVPETLRQCVAGMINTAGGFKWKVDEELLDACF